MKSVVLICWFFAMAFTFVAEYALADGLRSDPHPIMQPDGSTFTGKGFGDEFLSWYEAEDGYSVVRNLGNNWFYYAKLDADGKLVPSDLKVGEGDPSALGVSQHLTPSQEVQDHANAERQAFDASLSSSPISGPIKFKAILVDFPDPNRHGDPDYTIDDFDNMLFSIDSYETDPPDETGTPKSPDEELVFGSLNDYWWEMSYNQVEIGHVPGDTFPNILNETDSETGELIWYRMSRNSGDYPDDSTVIGPYADWSYLVQEALDSAQAHFPGIDYDNTFFAIIYAGTYAGGRTYLVQNSYKLSEKHGGGKFAHIGGHCHEFGHLLGLPHVPNYYTPGNECKWTTMSYGGKDNGPEGHGSCPAPINPDYRARLGWLDPQPITSDMYDEQIEFDIHSADVYRFDLRDGEYFLIENRQLTSGFNRYLPGNPDGGGLLIWHLAYEIWEGDELPFVDLEEADGSDDPVNADQDPFTNRNFNFCGVPNTDYNDPFDIGADNFFKRSDGGGPSHFAVNNISSNGSVMSADFLMNYGQKGDVNADCVVNILDVNRTVDMIINVGPTPTEHELWAADMNEDETINVLDVVLIVNVILEIPTDDSPPENYVLRLIETANGDYEVRLENPEGVYGVELHFSYNSTFNSLQKTVRSSVLDSAHNEESDTLIVLLYSSNGDTINAGNGSILDLSFSSGANPTLITAVLSTPGGSEIPVDIYHECGNPGQIMGYVKDNATHNPISNALVKLYTSGGSYTGQSDYSAGNGYFEITNVDPGSYYLMITQAGYDNKRDPVSGSFTVDCGETENRGTVYMTESCGLGKVKGYVKDNSTQNPISNALAKLYTSGGSYTGKSDYTNSSGYFQINNVSTGNYYLLVSESGYNTKRDPASGSFNVACGETVNRGTIYLIPTCSAPATPTGLDGSFVPGIPSNHPRITWNAVSGATSYKVYKSLDFGPYNFLASTTTTSYTDEGFCSGGGLIDVARYKVSALNSCGESAMTSNYKQFRGYQCAVSKELAETLNLEGFLLLQNYPNPFNPETEIAYGLAEPSYVRLVVYNVLGQEITTLVEEYEAAGMHTVSWDSKDQRGKDVPAGVYLYRFETDQFTDTKRMLLLK